MKTRLLIIAIFLTGNLALVSCSGEEGCTDPTATNYNANAEEDDGSCVFDTTSTGGDGNEDPAAGGILEKYDGTYNVTGDGHTRGTVIISDKGTKIDFDTNVQYDIDDNNVFDRISAFNRYQIEFYDENNNQDRIRINLDPNDPNTVVGFDYDPGADEQDIISVTVD